MGINIQRSEIEFEEDWNKMELVIPLGKALGIQPFFVEHIESLGFTATAEVVDQQATVSISKINDKTPNIEALQRSMTNLKRANPDIEALFF
ncbi:hypothetical protein JKY72_04415 [Candidatus Gracilibacteria bacterium]|nr:hypothetical protein [Candidatus Gracilibacteria bacterium]